MSKKLEFQFEDEADLLAAREIKNLMKTWKMGIDFATGPSEPAYVKWEHDKAHPLSFEEFAIVANFGADSTKAVHAEFEVIEEKPTKEIKLLNP